MANYSNAAGRQPRRLSKAQSRELARNVRNPATEQFMDENTRPAQKGQHKPVVALNEKQEDYGDAIAASRITFGIGPAGTGKTYFAAMKAAEALHNKEIVKIYLTRPAVEAGETLGFLPGDLEEKYEPYLRPFKDALHEFFGAGHTDYLIKNKIIEPVPLGFLRGATIKNAWLLADEMQNATKDQMKMLLTRMGKESKFIINGDPKQSDIAVSGLMDAVARVNSVEGVSYVQFSRADVVRDGIVQSILERYDE